LSDVFLGNLDDFLRGLEACEARVGSPSAAELIWFQLDFIRPPSKGFLFSCFGFYIVSIKFQEIFIYPKKGTGKSGKSHVPAEYFYSDPEWLALKGPTPPSRQKHASSVLNALAEFEVDLLNRQSMNQ
jgi:hypothetical protein